MAVAFRASSAISGNFTTTASPAVTAPTGMAAGDFVLIFLGINDAMTRHASPTLNGFTAATGAPGASGNGGTDCLYKIVDASDVSAGSWTFTNLWTATSSGRWGAVAYTGVDSSTPINTQASAMDNTPATITSPSITPSVDDCMIVFACGDDIGPTRTATPDSSPVANEREDSINANTGWVYIQDYLQGAAAAISLDATPSDATGGPFVHIFALKPAAAGGADPTTDVSPNILMM